jgi:CRP/FNR family transcriptional regulator, cyclic AMP receptor protein
MNPHDDRPPYGLHALLQSAGTPRSIGRYRPGAVIFLQGEACKNVLHIEKGRVRLSITSASGQEAVCGLLQAGAFLGEEVLDGHSVRHTATALTPTEVLEVAKPHMIRLLRTEQAISDRFIAHVLARHTDLEADLTEQLLHSSEQRLARTLVVLAGCDERRPCRCALPPISQQIIAEVVGTSRSRVNVIMGRLKKVGLLEVEDDGLHITPALLRIVADDRGEPMDHDGGGVHDSTASPHRVRYAGVHRSTMTDTAIRHADLDPRAESPAVGETERGVEASFAAHQSIRGERS